MTGGNTQRADVRRAGPVHFLLTPVVLTPPMPAPFVLLMSFLSDAQKRLVDRLGVVASDIEARMMLGTIGLYVDDVQIGVVEDDAVYLRASEESRSTFEEQGATPYNTGGGVAHASYFRVPSGILDEDEGLKIWVNHAQNAAR